MIANLVVVNVTSCQDVAVRPVDQVADAVTVTSCAEAGVATATSCPGVACQAAGSGCSLLVGAVVLVAGAVTCLV